MLSNLDDQLSIYSAQAKINGKAIKSVYSDSCVHAILNAAMIPAFIIDLSGIIQFWSFRLQSLTGWSKHLVTHQQISKYTMLDEDDVTNYLKIASTKDVQSGVMMHFNQQNAQEGTLRFTLKFISLRESGKLNGICGIVSQESAYGEENIGNLERDSQQVGIPMAQSEPTKKRRFSRRNKASNIAGNSDPQSSSLELRDKETTILKAQYSDFSVYRFANKTFANQEIDPQRFVVERSIMNCQYHLPSHALEDPIIDIFIKQSQRLGNNTSLHDTVDRLVIVVDCHVKTAWKYNIDQIKTLLTEHGFSASNLSKSSTVVAQAFKKIRDDQANKPGAVIALAQHGQSKTQGFALSLDPSVISSTKHVVSVYKALTPMSRYDKRAFVRYHCAWIRLTQGHRRAESDSFILFTDDHMNILAITRSRKIIGISEYSPKELFFKNVRTIDFPIGCRKIKRPFSPHFIANCINKDLAQEEALIVKRCRFKESARRSLFNNNKLDREMVCDRNDAYAAPTSEMDVSDLTEVFPNTSDGADTSPTFTRMNTRYFPHLPNELSQSIIDVVRSRQGISNRAALERDFYRLIDHINAPIFGVDINGQINMWNKKAVEITQYSSREVFGEKLVDNFIAGECRDGFADVITRALNGDDTSNYVVSLITKSGRFVSVSLNVTARYDRFDERTGVVAIAQGISERITQEHEYSRLIDTANAPIFGVDTYGCVTIWNKKAAEITQYTSSEVLGEKLEKFITDEYKDAVRSVLEKAFDGVETVNFEFPLITKLDRRVDILLNATSRFNEHGRVVGMVGIGQDISDRIAQEHEYSRLIDTANAPIFGVDATMCVNIWNKKAAQITNYSIDEVMGENLVETFISPEYRPIVADVLSKALKGIQTANFEFPLITRPGTRIEILLNATPRMDSNGNIVGVVGIGQDITDRIAQEHEYFHLIDTANAPIFGVDKNGNINEWNQKIEEITGYVKSSVLGLSLVNTFVIPENRMQVRQLLNQALTGVDVGEMELPMTTKQGFYLLLLVNASSKKDMHGNIRGAIGVGQDYTARKYMEEAKVNFLASFSHELRTPLNSILGMLELLKDKRGLDRDSERHVHMAYVSGSLLLNLINDILDLSKIETGHMEITAAPFHMNDLLDYSIEIFQFKARERNILLQQECSDDVPKQVIGDVVRLRQILLNLLSNAIKFTSEGSITVACSVVDEPALPPQFKKLLFQVIDTGVGMDAEDRSRLFCLFSKLERTRPNNPTGSGLGLAICKQLVELMDGAIDVASELNQGSNFYFTVIVRLLDEEQLILHRADDDLYSENIDLVISKAAAYLSEDEQHSNTIKGDCSSSLESISIPVSVVPNQARILVVEDNEFNWEVVKCYLQEDDHLLQWEANGQQAVQAYAKDNAKFDMIFMDCEMPVMDGYTATRLIRQYEAEYSLPRVPILGLTAYAMSGDRQKCVDAGMDEFIVKPISKVTLRKAVRHWRRAKYLGLDMQSNIFRPISPISGDDLTEMRSAITNSEPYTKSKCDGLRVTTIPSPRLFERSGNALARATLSPSPKYPVAPHVALCDGKKLYRRTEQVSEQSEPGLMPASRHMQQLDLASAISNLEMDNPVPASQYQQGTYSFRSGVNSIFSCGSSTANQSLSLRSSLGDSTFYTTWKTHRDSILSATLPAAFHNTVDRNSNEEEKSGAQNEEMKQMIPSHNQSQRSRSRQNSDRESFFGRARNKVRRQKSHRHMSSENNPTLWSHPPVPSKEKHRGSAEREKMIPFESINDILLQHDQRDTQSCDRARHQLQTHNPDDRVGRQQDALSPLSHRKEVPRLPESEKSVHIFLDSPASTSIDPLDITIPEGDPINYALGVEQCGGHEDLFVNLLEKFWVNCDQIMSRIELSYHSRDFSLIQRDAHTLKGSSAYVAALRISTVAFRLQVACEHAYKATQTSLPTCEYVYIIVDKTYELLRKEHRLLCGYFRRNFAFAAAPTLTGQLDTCLEQRTDEKPCALM